MFVYTQTKPCIPFTCKLRLTYDKVVNKKMGLSYRRTHETRVKSNYTRKRRLSVAAKVQVRTFIIFASAITVEP